MDKEKDIFITISIVSGVGFLLIWIVFLTLTSATAIAAEPVNPQRGDILKSYALQDHFVYIPAVMNNSTGKIIRVLVKGEGEGDNYEQATRAFEESTGHNVIYEGVDDFEDVIGDRVLTGQAPDVAVFPNLWHLGKFVKGAHTVDLNDWFTMTYLQGQYAPSWLDMATIEGEMAGVWYKSGPKSLVWYPKDDFITAGYLIPNTWAEMLTLSDQMVMDGHTPWCIGIESGGATGWVGTDWVEDIMLRTTTSENYDKWVTNELKFVSPEVENAWTTMGDIWFDDDYVLGGRHAITSTYFGDSIQPMFNNPPDCWLHRQASFIPAFFPPGIDIGEDVDYFYLPPIDPLYGDPVLIFGEIAGVFNDRPEVREYVRHLTTGESVRYFVEQGGIISPHKDSSLDWYPTAADRGYAEIVMNADTVRFDASDLMPDEIGAGEFWDGIVDYVEGEDLAAILARIDAAWP